MKNDEFKPLRVTSMLKVFIVPKWKLKVTLKTSRCTIMYGNINVYYLAVCCQVDTKLCSSYESGSIESVRPPQGKSYPFHASFPPMWNPFDIMDFNNLFRTMDEMGKEVKL